MRERYTVKKEERQSWDSQGLGVGVWGLGLLGSGGGKMRDGDSQVFPPQLTDTRPLTMGVGPDWGLKYRLGWYECVVCPYPIRG